MFICVNECKKEQDDILAIESVYSDQSVYSSHSEHEASPARNSSTRVDFSNPGFHGPIRHGWSILRPSKHAFAC